MMIHITVADDIILINIYFGRIKDFHSQWKQLKSSSWFLSAYGECSFLVTALHVTTLVVYAAGVHCFYFLKGVLLQVARVEYSFIDRCLKY